MARDEEVWKKVDAWLAKMPKNVRGIERSPLDMRDPPKEGSIMEKDGPVFGKQCAGMLIAAIVLGHVLLSATPTWAYTAVGDWGHFLAANSYDQEEVRIFLNNPDGKAFTVTVNRMRWVCVGWNPTNFTIKVTDPTGKILIEGESPMEDATRTLDIPAGPKGAYLVEIGKAAVWRQWGVYFWLESSLNQSVVWTGNPAGWALTDHWLVTQCSVPRRWWFWVPSGIEEFTARSQRDIGNTEREDWGITIFSPRGQRIRTMWGQPWLVTNAWAGGKEWRGEMNVRVPVEPGTAGRFWSAEVRLGDSHNYSKLSMSLDGIPPYVARSPEEWFNPETGASAPVQPYDEALFMQSRRNEKLKWQMWSPSPSLGDPDGIEIRGDGSFLLWNPENRSLRFDICDYLVRQNTTNAPVPEAKVVIVNSAGKEIFNETMTVPEHHNGAREPRLMPETGKGVVQLSVAGADRWFAYTYPATPLVWPGKKIEDGYSRFVFEVGTARNWYFLVPRGTKTFSVRVHAEHDTDVNYVEINAPDRTQAMIYGREGQTEVSVPEGSDGKIWHIRTDVGSATRMFTTGDQANYRYLGIYVTLDIKGVPGYLAPTWEQWFNPQNPAPATLRP